MSAVEAVVLTHHHADDRGNAERLRKEAGTKVLVHLDDHASATHRQKVPRGPVWKPGVLRYLVHTARSGAFRAVLAPLVQVSTFGDEEVLDLPGRPRVIHTPGHTAGSAAMVLEDRDVLIAGDALVTIDLSIMEHVVSHVEEVLGQAGVSPRRETQPPAIVFLDLAGYTKLTEERGDDAAAELAASLATLVQGEAQRRGG